jgi:hypothetical protein
VPGASLPPRSRYPLTLLVSHTFKSHAIQILMIYDSGLQYHIIVRPRFFISVPESNTQIIATPKSRALSCQEICGCLYRVYYFALRSAFTWLYIYRLSDTVRSATSFSCKQLIAVRWPYERHINLQHQPSSFPNNSCPTPGTFWYPLPQSSQHLSYSSTQKPIPLLTAPPKVPLISSSIVSISGN